MQHLKSRFGQGYQIEMKVKHPTDKDEDVINTTAGILQGLNVLNALNGDIETGEIHKLASVTNIKLDKVKDVCHDLTGDDYLSNMINEDDPNGYKVFKLADSPLGITVDDLVGFCVEELRLKALVDFFQCSYSSAILRERQDVKIRFEINSEGVTISSVFANIEEHK